MTNTFTLKSGTSKGNRRIWIEGNRLLEAGWTKGDRLVRSMELQFTSTSTVADVIVLTRGEGKHRVSGNEGRPILDMTGKWVTDFMGENSHFRVKLESDKITITPCDTNLEERAK